MAKRFYDMAAETSTDAYMPVSLALMKLTALFLVEYFKEVSLKILHTQVDGNSTHIIFIILVVVIAHCVQC